MHELRDIFNERTEDLQNPCSSEWPAESSEIPATKWVFLFSSTLILSFNVRYTAPVKSLDAPNSMLFLYFYDLKDIHHVFSVISLYLVLDLI